jgi:hypothetical protein
MRERIPLASSIFSKLFLDILAVSIKEDKKKSIPNEKK